MMHSLLMEREANETVTVNLPPFPKSWSSTHLYTYPLFYSAALLLSHVSRHVRQSYCLTHPFLALWLYLSDVFRAVKGTDKNTLFPQNLRASRSLTALVQYWSEWQSRRVKAALLKCGALFCPPSSSGIPSMIRCCIWAHCVSSGCCYCSLTLGQNFTSLLREKLDSCHAGYKHIVSLKMNPFHYQRQYDLLSVLSMYSLTCITRGIKSCFAYCQDSISIVCYFTFLLHYS